MMNQDLLLSGPYIQRVDIQQRMASEVLELGQSLFDTVIEAAANRAQADSESGKPFPLEDVRAAADEFFEALRLLLGVR